ncbi:MAG: EAL domain-containing protein [Desulfobacterales bacterium]|nr:EAL domain-containing protein [Desulfobacterales bacterium]
MGSIFKSFRFKIILFFTVLVTSLQLTTFIAVYRATLTNVLTQIEGQLTSTGHTLLRQLEIRAGNLAREAGILAADFGFRTAVATQDSPTIVSALVSMINRINGDRAMVISLDNRIVSDTFKGKKGGEDFPFLDLIERADNQGQAVSILVMDGIIYEFTIVPVLAPVPIAWIGIGQSMDNALAMKLKAQSPFGLDISFGLLTGSSGLEIKGSTLEPDHQDEVAQVDFKKIPADTPRKVVSGNDTYVTLLKSLDIGGGSAGTIVLLQYSLDLAMKPFRKLILWFSVIALVSLIPALIAGVWIASGVTRPVQSLSLAVRRIRSGDYSTPVPVAGPDELGHLAQGFNHMIAGIRQREEQIFHQAHHDVLTGLPNRLKFEIRLDEMIESHGANNQFCVVFIGLDRLTQIRNTLGHHVGDIAVKLVSERLLNVSGPSDILARPASDAFMLLLPSVNLEGAGNVLEKFMGCFKNPLTIKEVNMDVNAHMGVACYPVHGKDGKLLMQRADAAMYTASKTASAGRYSVYDESKDPHTLNKLSLMVELREGLDRGEFELYYQPKISLKTRKIAHAEALIRWMHPENGFTPPDEFIPLAEQTGNIHHITDFSLRTAIGQCMKWQDLGYPVKVSVNISARDLLTFDLIGKIKSLLNEANMDPDLLILEITESAVMQDPEKALQMLRTLNGIGIRLSMDDFGTGYSSMSYLKRLPIQEIKVDKSFVMELAKNHEDAVIVKSTVEMGHNLGLTVIAEGVEDEASLDMLTRLGCDLGQGYYFSRPLPEKEFEDWLETSPWGYTIGQQQGHG